MQKLFLYIITCFLALCASVAQAQVELTVSPHSWVPQERLTLFGEEDVLSSSVAITTGPQKVYLSALVYRIEGCSSRNPVGSALRMFTLNTPLMIVAGQEFQVDQARFVRFPIETILPPNTSLQHTVFNDVASYTEANIFDKKCVHLTLERSGLETKAVVSGNFPLQGSGLTIVRSKPTVTITPIGPTTNRIRAINDDVFYYV